VVDNIVNKHNKYGDIHLLLACEKNSEIFNWEWVDFNKESRYGQAPFFASFKNDTKNIFELLIKIMIFFYSSNVKWQWKSWYYFIFIKKKSRYKLSG